MDLGALGEHIRGLRLDRDLTLQQLAERCGVSVSMLSSVERADKAATIVVLDRIAVGLGLPLADLLAGQSGDRVVVRRRAEQDVALEPGGWRRTVLTPVIPGVNFEWLRVELPPECDAGTFDAYAAGSHEFVVVEAGELTLTVDGARHVLTGGDSLYYAADAPHGYANHTDTPCSYHVAALIMRSRRPGRAARPAS